MKNLIRKNFVAIIGLLVGAVLGYTYWYFWGCQEGCTIRSVWWRMSIWGALMGVLLFSALEDTLKKRRRN